MSELKEIFEFRFLGNSLLDYCLALLLFLVLILIFRFVKSSALKRLHALADETESDLDDKIVEVGESISGVFLAFVSLYFSIKTLTIDSLVDKWIDSIFLIIAVLQVTKLAQVLLTFLFKKMSSKKYATPIDQKNFAGITLVIKIFIWSIATILILSNLGFNVNTLITSLGIGGVAIALAVQNILSDIFSSFSIYFDKPFEIGDFISVGTDKGHVIDVGLKTTRIKTLHGEELVIPNQELTKTKVLNFRKMKQRRIVIKLSLIYELKHADLIKVKKIVQEIVESVEGAQFDRVHMFDFADSSIDFELVYFVKSNDFKVYMDVREEINLKIFAEFEKEGYGFAYPTQTSYVKNLS